MLDASLKQQLSTYFGNINRAVEVVLFIDDSSKSMELQTLANELAELSSFIKVTKEQDKQQRIPSMGIRQPGQPASIFFAGIPMGALANVHSVTTLGEQAEIYFKSDPTLKQKGKNP